MVAKRVRNRIWEKVSRRSPVMRSAVKLMAVTRTGPSLVNAQCLAEEAFKRGPVTVVTLNRLMVEKTARNWGQIRSHKSATLKHVPPKAKIIKAKSVKKEKRKMRMTKINETKRERKVNRLMERRTRK